MSKEAMKLALEAFEDRTSLMKWQKARVEDCYKQGKIGRAVQMLKDKNT